MKATNDIDPGTKVIVAGSTMQKEIPIEQEEVSRSRLSLATVQLLLQIIELLLLPLNLFCQLSYIGGRRGIVCPTVAAVVEEQAHEAQ